MKVLANDGISQNAVDILNKNVLMFICVARTYKNNRKKTKDNFNKDRLHRSYS